MAVSQNACWSRPGFPTPTMNEARRRVIVIPAHGEGTRLREVTAGRAKTLMEVAGEPILARLLRAATADGAHVVVYAHGQLTPRCPPAPAAYGRGVQVSRHEPTTVPMARTVPIPGTVAAEIAAPETEISSTLQVSLLPSARMT